MSALIPFLVLDQPCEQLKAWINEKLTNAGFRVVQTFDLQVARLAHEDCTCPHHGTADCNCQMIVLLVYRNNTEPVTLIIHGQDSKTWISLVSPAEKRSSQHLEASIRRVLAPHRAGSASNIEVTYEARPTR